MKKKRKGLLFRFVQACLRPGYKKYKILGKENIPDEPCVIVGNHSQIYGPITAQLNKDYSRYIWCDAQIMNLKTAPKYARSDFWPYKPKTVKWFYNGLSYLIAPLAVYVFTNADTIPVYRDRNLVKTFRESINRLKSGSNIIIFPECHKEYNNIVNEFQSKFIKLAQGYYRAEGKCLKFVPMYIAPKIKTIVYGKSVSYKENISIEEQLESISFYLKEEISSLAKSLPRHKVVPYANIKKKNYLYSKEDDGEEVKKV